MAYFNYTEEVMSTKGQYTRSFSTLSWVVPCKTHYLQLDYHYHNLNK